MRSFAGWTLCAIMAGCGGHKPAPVQALQQYSAALEGHDYRRAYRMMSAEFRQQYSEDDFIRMMKDNPKEVEETARRLAGRHSDVRVTAELEYGLGDRMVLVQEDGQWRIASNPIDFYSQRTPRAALRSFVRAYRLERWDVMLRLVPDDYAEKMDEDAVRKQFHGPRREEIAMMMNMLEANLDAPIQEKGRRASMPYGGSYEVKFVKEGDAWKVQDPD